MTGDTQRRKEQRFRSLALQISQLHENDRWAVSAAIHDKVLQTLNVAHLTAERTLKNCLLEGKPPGESDSARELRDRIAEAIEETQNLMHELSSPVLKYLGLASAIRWLVDKYSQGGRIRISVDEQTGASEPLPEGIKHTAFAVAKEIFRYVCECSAVDRLEVHIFQGDSAFSLDFEWASSCDLPERMNLAGQDLETGRIVINEDSLKDSVVLRLACLREQARSMNGDVKIESSAEGGAHVSLSIPREHSHITE